jgi:hypothetical protein
MGIKTSKPTSPGRRFYSVSDFADITKTTPEKRLVEKQSATGGRNNMGRITSRFRGGGHKQRYRLVDFKRDKIGVPAKVASIEYDPNRTARIALLHYVDGEKRYILAPDGLAVGSTVLASRHADIKVGNSLRLRDLPPGTTIHNIELKKGKGGSSFAPPVSRRSSWRRMATGRRFVCPAARSARSTWSAARRWARSPSRSTPTSASARPAASAGSVAGLTTAASR